MTSEEQRELMARDVGWITMETATLEFVACCLLQAAAPSTWTTERLRETHKHTWRISQAIHGLSSIAPDAYEDRLTQWASAFDTLIDERNQWSHAFARYDVPGMGDTGWWLEHPSSGSRPYDFDEAGDLLRRLKETQLAAMVMMYELIPGDVLADYGRTDEGGEA